MPASTAKKPSRIQSVARASQLLTLVASKRTNNSGKALAEAAGLAVPTAHHLLSTLAAEGLLAQDERARYLLGPKITVLANALDRDGAPPGYMLSTLHEIAEKTGETAYLVKWRRSDIQIVNVVEGTHPVRVVVPEGPYRDAHARASGKLFLAFLDEDIREDYLRSHPIRKLTPNTISARGKLMKDLETIRERGYAIDQEEFQEGVSCVSVPVFEDDVILAGYSISVPTQRFDEHRERLISVLLELASAATRGYAP